MHSGLDFTLIVFFAATALVCVSRAKGLKATNQHIKLAVIIIITKRIHEFSPKNFLLHCNVFMDLNIKALKCFFSCISNRIPGTTLLRPLTRDGSSRTKYG